MKGDARNRRLRDLVRRLVQATNREPSVVLVEDLQWIDPASAVFLETLVEAVPGSGGLVVATFRPEFRASWMSGSYYRQIPLTVLPQDALNALLDELLGPDRSLDGLSELISERTGGNPLYVEEIVRELDESGTLDGDRGAYRMAREIDELPVPPTVQAIIAARIDRLTPDAKVTLQTAAAIGSETSRELLGVVVDLDEEALDASDPNADRDGVPARDRPLPRADPGLPPPPDPGDRLRLPARTGPRPRPHRDRHGARGHRPRTRRRERGHDRPALRARRERDEGRRVAPPRPRVGRSARPDGVHPPRAADRRSRRRHPERRRRRPACDSPPGCTSRRWVGAWAPIRRSSRKAFDEGVLIAERTGNTMVLALLHTAFSACPLDL